MKAIENPVRGKGLSAYYLWYECNARLFLLLSKSFTKKIALPSSKRVEVSDQEIGRAAKVSIHFSIILLPLDPLRVCPVVRSIGP